MFFVFQETVSSTRYANTCGSSFDSVLLIFESSSLVSSLSH